MLLWEVDQEAGQRDNGAAELPLAEMEWTIGNGKSAPHKDSPESLEDEVPHCPAAPPPRLKEYTTERRRSEAYAALGFTTDVHPMDLHTNQLRQFRVIPSTQLHRHVGKSVLAAGMLTTSKPVHTAKDEPMEFATFDDGAGLIETVLFPGVYRERGHVLFDQGPFIFRGKVEEEFGAVTVTITQLDRLERMVAKTGGRRQSDGGSY